jgi:hypothetical protein
MELPGSYSPENFPSWNQLFRAVAEFDLCTSAVVDAE